MIETAAGTGGMGEVYKAKDTRLDRTVAIKVLPAATQNNADLRARFEREAKAISSLNHPHICTLFDVGHEDGLDFLVMEYLEGRTLAEILKTGPLEAEDLFSYGTQIADALDSAHRKGLIHRDLKPGNVIITRDGAKLLDFGLAKLKIEEGMVEGISHITQTTPLTGAGTIIGTIQYMAPEQLEGMEADARSDIFAFGALLYEMATGRSAFSGKSQASLIASILKEKPRPMSEVITMTPPALERLVNKCLDKEPDRRWQSASDLRDELRWISQSGSQAGVPSPVSARRKLRLRLGWALATVSTLAAIVLAALYFAQPEPERTVHRFTITADSGYRNVRWPMISPDGQLLTFRATDTLGVSRTYVRPVSALEANALPGTEDAGRHFWSPDSKYIAFFAGQQLKKVPVGGGPAQLICETNGADGHWGASGTILFDNSQTDSIRQVPATGGVPVAATTINRDAGETYHAWPWFFPDGNRFYYLAGVTNSSTAGSAYRLKIGSLDGSVDTTIGNLPGRCIYASESQIIYGLDGLLMLQEIDLDSYEFIDGPRPLAQSLATINENGIFSASETGTLVYQVGASVSTSQLIWVDREGNELEILGESATYQDIALSPDETKLAYGLQDLRANGRDLWVMDLNRRISSRLTFGKDDEMWPIWSQDGEHIAYSDNSDGVYRIVSRRSNGLGDAVEIYNPPAPTGPSQWLDQKNTMVVLELEDGFAVKILNLKDSTKNLAIRADGDFIAGGQISPDGRFIAYQSTESGSSEIYVRELSASGGKWQVSRDGGVSPRWRGDGKEIFFRDPPDKWYAVPVQTERGFFEAGVPELLFQHRVAINNPMQFRYDVSSDGQRFLLNAPIEEESETYFVVVLNWDAQLEK